MTPQIVTTISLSIISFGITWCVWVSVSVFKHAEEISLLKREIKVLIEVKEVLDDIKSQLTQNHIDHRERMSRGL